MRIHGVIAAQVAAFRAGDLDEAFSYAAPNIQATFGDAQTFGLMVEQGYEQIFATRDYEFVDLIGTMDSPIQVVSFVGEDLTSVMAFYFMKISSTGQWRIAGVQSREIDRQAI